MLFILQFSENSQCMVHSQRGDNSNVFIDQKEHNTEIFLVVACFALHLTIFLQCNTANVGVKHQSIILHQKGDNSNVLTDQKVHNTEIFLVYFYRKTNRRYALKVIDKAKCKGKVSILRNVILYYFFTFTKIYLII